MAAEEVTVEEEEVTEEVAAATVEGAVMEEVPSKQRIL